MAISVFWEATSYHCIQKKEGTVLRDHQEGIYPLLGIYSYCFYKNKIRFLAVLHGDSRPPAILSTVFRKEILKRVKLKEGLVTQGIRTRVSGATSFRSASYSGCELRQFKQSEFPSGMEIITVPTSAGSWQD